MSAQAVSPDAQLPGQPPFGTDTVEVKGLESGSEPDIWTAA